ncbi:GMC oxidoreductase [Jaapia argillacea MUCL 33604]|uniref:GMC oxidoreductase n=1 Tax=Jaapia argillacea MUCL 33604 TaxID=933084 RepID=A0A067PZT3_9AGAM|nr:GMC oxidoreductase [Jaapia argillacea MUCL 33604]
MAAQTAKLEDVADKSFDYVIVGGGTAGLCLAARLTEDPSISVVVLESGDANLNDPALLRPASYGAHFGNENYDWAFKTTAQVHCKGNQFLWQRGKGLGGSSAINFLCWTKPPADEIDDWERLGNPGWNWENYDKFSKRTEKFVYPTPEIQAKHNLKLSDWRCGSEGTLLTAFPAKIPAAELDLQQTLIKLGIPVAEAPLDGSPQGVYFAPNTLDPKTATRTYATTAFYLPNASRSNLNILVRAHASKLITSKSLGGSVTASGVQFFYGKKECVVKAKKEVLLCAGALKSPQILELSGIGSQSLLQRLRIPSEIDLPGVGENIQEHVFTGITFELKDDASFETLDILRDPKVATEHLELHAAGKGEGLFNMGIIGFAFASLNLLSDSASSIHHAAQILYSQKGQPKNAVEEGIKEQWKIQVERLEKGGPGCELISFPGFLSYPNPPQEGKKYISVLVAMNHFFSRGTIHSISKDAKIDPAFDPHYFEEEIDLKTFIESVKFVRNKVANTAPFKNLIVQEVNPGPAVESDEQIGDWLKKYMTTTYHTAGSCSMLPREKGGVVDPRLKVYGTSNVRVVDMSIVPLHFAAHTQATAYAIAEQAADIIQGKL